MSRPPPRFVPTLTEVVQPKAPAPQERPAASAVDLQRMHAHHRDRLAEVLHACQTKPCSGADILPVMFKRPLDLHQTTFALGEAVAHLHTLWVEGILQRRLGADGVYRFQAA